mgnify:CR=1 FL=1
MKGIKIIFVVVFLVIAAMLAGCSFVNDYSESAERSRELDFSNKKSEWENCIEKGILNWQIVEMPRNGNKRLNMKLPFEFDDCRKYDDLPDIKNLESYIHKENKSLIMINHGVIVKPNKKVRFDMDTFCDLVDDVKEKELIKSENKNINGKNVTYILCKGKTKKDNNECTMEFVGVQVDNDYWMISYYYYSEDELMAEVARRSIESIRIK